MNKGKKTNKGITYVVKYDHLYICGQTWWRKSEDLGGKLQTYTYIPCGQT